MDPAAACPGTTPQGNLLAGLTQKGPSALTHCLPGVPRLCQPFHLPDCSIALRTDSPSPSKTHWASPAALWFLGGGCPCVASLAHPQSPWCFLRFQEFHF